VNALANSTVGEFLNANCVSSFQKIGTFQIQGDQKQGGNVASYFTTPNGRVLHVIAGPVNADTLLREARWVTETYKLAMLESKGDLNRFKEIFRRAHADRLRQDHGLNIDPSVLPSSGSSPAMMTVLLGKMANQKALGKQAQVHILLTAAPLAKIEQIYKVVFENILGEKVSTNPVVKT
jgi:hypothetical protein